MGPALPAKRACVPRHDDAEDLAPASGTIPYCHCPRKAGNPVRRGLSTRALLSLEYWVARSRLRQEASARPRVQGRAGALAKAASRAMTSVDWLTVEAEAVSSLRGASRRPVRRSPTGEGGSNPDYRRGGILDCFAEPVIGPRFARTRWLAMTNS